VSTGEIENARGSLQWNNDNDEHIIVIGLLMRSEGVSEEIKGGENGRGRRIGGE
jgi:hypothetical protein